MLLDAAKELRRIGINWHRWEIIRWLREENEKVLASVYEHYKAVV